MWIIRKNGGSVRELSVDERALLVQFADGSCHGFAFDRASRLLRSVRQDNHWLACGCAKPAPTLNVAMRDTGQLVLRNNPTDAAHEESCPFAKMESSGDSARRTAAPISRYLPDSEISLHDEFAAPAQAGGESPRAGGSKVGSQSRRKRQLSLLYTLIEAAGLHEYDPGSPKSISDQYQRLREVAGRYHLVGRVPLQLDTHLDKRALTLMAQRLRESTFFGRHRRVGLLLDMIEKVAGRELVLHGGKTLDFHGHLERVGTTQGPLLALVTVTNQAQSARYFEVGNVGVISALSRSCLMPVLDEAERMPLGELTALLDWLYKKHQRRVVMRRDLFAGGACIELVGRDRSISVQLFGHPLVEDEDTLLLSDPTKIDVFKKRVVKAFLSEVQA